MASLQLKTKCTRKKRKFGHMAKCSESDKLFHGKAILTCWRTSESLLQNKNARSFSGEISSLVSYSCIIKFFCLNCGPHATGSKINNPQKSLLLRLDPRLIPTEEELSRLDLDQIPAKAKNLGNSL